VETPAGSPATRSVRPDRRFRACACGPGPGDHRLRGHGAGARPRPAQQGYGGAVQPNKLGELDCNGFSPIQRSVKLNLPCADPHGSDGGRFLDHGHYIGHDEPPMRFVSTRPGSGNNFSITENLPADPASLPTVKTPGKDVTHWFELTIAPWFSADVCDPNSAPLQQLPTSGGRRYPQIQFMTDTSATEFNTGCNLVSGRAVSCRRRARGTSSRSSPWRRWRAAVCGSSAT
jgi:hypothetical protein